MRRTACLIGALALVGCSSPAVRSSAPLVHVIGPSRCRGAAARPDARCTPGDADPRVTAANIASTICRRGYSSSVRPPEEVTHAIKVHMVAAYGLTGTPFARLELDHLVPLSLGGASDERNLWPEPRGGATGAEAKDVVEVRLHEQVCRGEVDLRVAQQAIARDWLTAP